MATIFHYNKEDKTEFFRGGVQVIDGIKVPFLQDLLKSESLTVITELSMQNSETIQFFMTFDDVISWFYFGKGMGNLIIKGLLLTNDKGTPGLTIFLNQVMLNTRGTLVEVSIGSAVFGCVLSNFGLNMTQDPSPVAEFTLHMNIVRHNLPGRAVQQYDCNKYNSDPVDAVTSAVQGLI